MEKYVGMGTGENGEIWNRSRIKRWGNGGDGKMGNGSREMERCRSEGGERVK